MDIFPVHVRACVFVLAAYSVASLYILFFSRHKYLLKWSMGWAIITSAAFLSGHMAIFVAVVIAVSIFILPSKPSERVKYYFVLLPVIPLFVYDIPGPLGINLLLDLTYARLLTLAILVPAFIKLISQSGGITKKFLNGPTDKLLFFYVLLLSLLAFRNTTVTSGFREALNVVALDIFLPYYVISRSVQTLDDFRGVFMAILFSAIMLAFLGLLEQITYWSFFRYLPDLLDFRPITVNAFGEVRGMFLRTNTTMGPITLGYFIVLALGIAIYLRELLPKQKTFLFFSLVLFLIILISTGSRGAWLTAIALLMLYMYLKISDRWLRIILLLGGIISVFLGKILLDVIGGLSADSIDDHGTFQYRIDLIKTSANVIKNNILFGTDDPNRGGALESMRQGQGIIDIVNTYLALLLYYGVVGFSLFMAIFFVTLRNLYSASKSVKKYKKVWLLGNMLIAMTGATLILIGTVSSVSFIPIYYWSLIGLVSAYVRMCQRHQHYIKKVNNSFEQVISVRSKLVPTQIYPHRSAGN